MKQKKFLLPGTLIIILTLMTTACPQPTDDDKPDPEITGFTFTQTAGLQAGTENSQPGAAAGTFSDPVGGTAPFTYSLMEGSEGNDADNVYFEIVDDNKLAVKDYALSATGSAPYKVHLQVTDSKGKTFSKAAEIIVDTASDGSPALTPTNFTFTATSGLRENTDGVKEGMIAGTILAVTGGTRPYSFELTTSSTASQHADNGKFEIIGNVLKIKGEALTVGTKRIYIKVTDANSDSYAKAVTLTVAINLGIKEYMVTTENFTPATAVSSSTSTASVTVESGKLKITSEGAGTFTIYAYDADHYEVAITGLSVNADGQITGTPAESKSTYPVYNSADTAGGSVFTEIQGKTSGTYLLRGAPTRPAVDENGKSDWGIPAGVTLVLMDGSTWHMHTQYNYTGLGTFKYEATSGNATMLPGGTPPAPYTFQVSTLEIGGTLWLVTGIERIYGAMTSPGGIVRLLGGTKLLTGESGSETLAVTDTAEHGGAYWHVIVKNLVLGSSTLTVKDTITFAAVTVTENATYGSNAFTMDSEALGLGTSGGSLIINAPGKTVTVKSIDCENGALSEIHVQAGTLAITDEDGLKNKGAAAITVESGASFTINDAEYSE
jgi:hypothetical protein